MGKSHKEKVKKRKQRTADESSDSSIEQQDARKAKKNKKASCRLFTQEKKQSKKERKLLREAKNFLKNKLGDRELSREDNRAVSPEAQIASITADSYFERNPEFTAWLRETQSSFFGDLSSQEARSLFVHFVDDWNDRKLPRKYYAGMAPSAARRSQHSWSLQGRSAEEVKLGIAAALEEERETRAAERGKEQAEQRRWKEDQKLLLEEMLPKATGREAQIEKRVIQREKNKAREASPDVMQMPGGGDLYGGDDSFSAARARQLQHGEARREKHRAQKGELADARLREAMSKEEEKMAQFRALAAKGPIQIAKRQ